MNLVPHTDSCLCVDCNWRERAETAEQRYLEETAELRSVIADLHAAVAHVQRERDEARVRDEITALCKTAEQVTCNHEQVTGGNDYQLCGACGLMWDYRRETSIEAASKQLKSALLAAPPTPLESK